MAKFFISYRRGDSAGHTGRLNDSLAQRFGHDAVFRDIEDLAPGVDFAHELDSALSQCRAMLVVIGRTWATVSDDKGRRLARDGDFVRHEVATGLQRDDMLVIPVLVDGAKLPAEAELTDDLKSLREKQTIEISDDRWDYDVQRLGDALAARLGFDEVAVAPLRSKRLASFGILAAAIVALVAGVALLVGSQRGPGDVPDTTVAASAPTTEAFDRNDTVEADLDEFDAVPTTVNTTPIDSTTSAPLPDDSFDIPTFVVSGFTWITTTEEAGAVDWLEASAYCDDLSILGRSFRLPTVEELELLVDTSDVDAFDRQILRVFHDGLGSNWIWSSDADGSASAFAFDFITLETVSLAVNFDEGARALCVSA